MFIIKKKPLTPNIIWDAENNKSLCKFIKGIIETNDVSLVTKLQELGHEVLGEADEADEMIIDLDETNKKEDVPEDNQSSRSKIKRR